MARRRTLLLGALLALLASAPSSTAEAAVTIGSDLRGPFDPLEGDDECGVPDGCAGIHYTLPQRATHAPFDGVITRWRVRGTGSLRLFVARYVAYDTVIRKATSAPRRGTSVEAVSTFSTRLPIRHGEHVGIILDSDAIIRSRVNTDAYLDIFVPPPPTGEPSSAQGDFLDQAIEAVHNADVEPDADQDGYGDETQDLCPTSAMSRLPCPIGPAPAQDITAPRLLGPPRARAAKRVRGARVQFRLSEPGEVRVTLSRRTTRRRARGRYVRLRAFSRAARAGSNRMLIRRRGGRALRAGRYKLTIVAHDAAGNRSEPAKLHFRVRR